MLQLINELRENWRRRVDRWKSKALQEVLADLKIDRNSKRDGTFFCEQEDDNCYYNVDNCISSLRSDHPEI